MLIEFVHQKKTLASLALVFLILAAVFPAVSAAGTNDSAGPTTSSRPSLVSASENILAVSANPNFTLSANPAILAMVAGGSQTSQLDLASQNGFSDKVYLATVFSFPLIASLNPTNVQLTAGGTANTKLTIVAPVNTPAGDYIVFVDAVGGCSIFHYVEISVTVTGPDFTISAEKTQMTISPGGSDTSKINLASQNGFSGTVNLFSFSYPVTGTPDLPTVTLTEGGTASVTLTVEVPFVIDPGIYTVTLDASGGALLHHSVDVLVTVPGTPPPDFELLATPDSLTILAGASQTSTITVVPIGSFADTVDLVVNPSYPPGITASVEPSVNVPPDYATLTVTVPAGTDPGTYLLVVTGTSGLLESEALITVTVKGPDFQISADHPVLAVVAGGSSCTSTVTVTGVEEFNGNVALTHKEFDFMAREAPELIITLTPSSIPGGSGTSTLTASATVTAVPGFYYVDVKGTSTSPALTHSESIYVIVIGPDFSLSSNPAFLIAEAGGTSGTSVISMTVENDFSSSVNLVASSFDPLLTATILPPTISGSATATLTVTASAGTPPGGFYVVEVNGTSGQLTHSIYIPVTVVGPDFSVSASPSSLTLDAGASADTEISITPTLGFNSPVDLTVYPSSSDLTATVLPTTITRFETATMSVTSTVPGTYSVEILAISGSLVHYTSVTVTVHGPDFDLSANPSSLTIIAGSSAQSTIIVTPLHSFAGSVSLTASPASPPSGITATFNPTSITSQQTSILTVNVDASTIPGDYAVDVQGTSGSISHSITINVKISGFTISADPDTLTIAQATQKISTITVTSQSGFNGQVILTTSAPAGLTATADPSSITGSGTSIVTVSASSTITPGTYTVTITGKNGALTHSVTITVNVPAPDFSIAPSTTTTVPCTQAAYCSTTITITALNNFAGLVTFTATPTSGLLLCTAPGAVTGSGSTTLSCSSSSTGDLTVTVTGSSGSLIRTTATITYHVSALPDFSVSASAAAPSTILAAGSGTSTITVTGQNGFDAAVTFTVSDSTPSGLTCPVPNSITGPGTSTLACNAAASGDYTVTVTGTATINGSPVSHTTDSILFHVVDFTVSAGSVTPSAVLQGDTASSTITVTSQNGFSDTVELTSSISTPTGLTCNLLASVTGGSGSSTLSCSASAAGDYAVTVTGTSSSIYHSTSGIVFHVQGFTVSATTPASITSGQSTSSTINVMAVNGFSGTVTFTVAVNPSSGLSCNTLEPSTGPGTRTLTCTGTSQGTYTATITSRSGAVSQQNILTFTVNPSQTGGAAQQPILGLEPVQFYSVLAVLLVGVVVAAGVMIQRARKKPSA